jgi:hypothetical protein
MSKEIELNLIENIQRRSDNFLGDESFCYLSGDGLSFSKMARAVNNWVTGFGETMKLPEAGSTRLNSFSLGFSLLGVKLHG